MTAKTEQKQRSHDAILRSAARLLRARGIAGARVADVMEGAGLTVGGFYAHFASKEALVDAVLRRVGDAIREQLFARLDEKPPGERLETVLRRYLHPKNRDEHESGCALPAVIGEIGSSAHEHGAAVADQVQLLAADLEKLLAGPERRQVALGLVSMMVGGLTLARATRGTALSDEILRACRALGALVGHTENRGEKS